MTEYLVNGDSLSFVEGTKKTEHNTLSSRVDTAETNIDVLGGRIDNLIVTASGTTVEYKIDDSKWYQSDYQSDSITYWRNSGMFDVVIDGETITDYEILDAHWGFAMIQNAVPFSVHGGLLIRKTSDNKIFYDIHSLSDRSDQYSYLYVNIKLSSGSGSGDPEVIDIRVGADGTTYDSAGEAIREQLNNKVDKTAISQAAVVTYTYFNDDDVSCFNTFTEAYDKFQNIKYQADVLYAIPGSTTGGRVDFTLTTCTTSKIELTGFLPEHNKIVVITQLPNDNISAASYLLSDDTHTDTEETTVSFDDIKSSAGNIAFRHEIEDLPEFSQDASITALVSRSSDFSAVLYVDDISNNVISSQNLTSSTGTFAVKFPPSYARIRIIVTSGMELRIQTRITYRKAINKVIHISDVVQEVGSAENKIMSQKAVTNTVIDVSDNILDIYDNKKYIDTDTWMPNTTAKTLNLDGLQSGRGAVKFIDVTGNSNTYNGTFSVMADASSPDAVTISGIKPDKWTFFAFPSNPTFSFKASTNNPARNFKVTVLYPAREKKTYDEYSYDIMSSTANAPKEVRFYNGSDLISVDTVKVSSITREASPDALKDFNDYSYHTLTYFTQETTWDKAAVYSNLTFPAVDWLDNADHIYITFGVAAMYYADSTKLPQNIAIVLNTDDPIQMNLSKVTDATSVYYNRSYVADLSTSSAREKWKKLLNGSSHECHLDITFTSAITTPANQYASFHMYETFSEITISQIIVE